MVRRVWVICLTISAIGVLSGCGDSSGDEASEVKSRPIRGEIEGDDWTFTTGTADISEDRLKIELFDGPSDPCSVDSRYYEDWIVWTEVPNRETRTELRLSSRDSQTVKFTQGAYSVVASNGFIEITSIGPDIVKGNMVARHQQSSVNGLFQAVRCEDEGGF